MKKGFIVLILIALVSAGGLILFFYYSNDSGNGNFNTNSEKMIINHNHAHLEDFTSIPSEWIIAAKANLSIVYWHTSHGSQITTGMSLLDAFMGDNDVYEFNNAGTGGALHYHEPSIDYSRRDLTGYTDQFDDETRTFLSSNPEYNVVIWSWCGLDKNNASINAYLTNMNQLESEYPNVHFVYMTAHLEGTGEDGDLHIYNQMIRRYCNKNNKTLYDFGDIESYNPENEYFLDRDANDGCYYDSDGNGSLDANWATEWQSTHDGTHTYPNGGEWYDCSPAHSEAVNGNLKAYAAWYLFARLAGWNGT
ncbi:MAG: hypothetical protein GF317_02310 [Candidatus Lokiarchaeota archaeon]|nr:hypothetical protein [Candidatus Lokiarchaeota archaeon]MBD3198741.1 hypothetical protein [Candidatus Lokiarchaeota archaeon]